MDDFDSIPAIGDVHIDDDVEEEEVDLDESKEEGEMVKNGKYHFNGKHRGQVGVS